MRETLLYPQTLTTEALAACIDLALVDPNHDAVDVEAACHEAVAYGFAAVTVAPYDVPRAADRLAGTGVRVGGTVGLPLGHSGLRAKRAEAQACINGGADEIEMVINLTAARSGLWADVRDEIYAVRQVAAGKVLKVVLECCYLSDDEKIRASELVADAGADFLLTSTGFGPGGATVEDVRLMRETVGPAVGVKAAGGLRTFRQCRAMLAAGATRIGTSTGAAIIHDFQESRAARHHA
jgi:deoxyribose-phosphate aldolase